MDITYKINLNRYSPSEIIDLYEDGLLTLEEIVSSGCIYSTFGSELREYVYNHMESQQKLLDSLLENTVVQKHQ